MSQDPGRPGHRHGHGGGGGGNGQPPAPGGGKSGGGGGPGRDPNAPGGPGSHGSGGGGGGNGPGGGNPHGGGGGGPGGGNNAVPHKDRSVYDEMVRLLNQWGIGSLAGEVKKLILSGQTTVDEITLALTQTKAYKQRFAGNAIRVANGLSELSPADYISLERSYAQVMRAYGLPPGFYDSHADFVKMIGNDISPTELQTRAQIAHDQYMFAPDYVKNLWAQYFGTKGDAIAAILDPKVATQVIQDRANQVAVGGAAAQFGLNINQRRAQQLTQAGVTQSQAQQGFSQIASNLGTDQMIAQRFGTSFNQDDEINSTLLGQADAVNKRQNIYDAEQALFHSANATSNPSDAFGVSQDY